MDNGKDVRLILITDDATTTCRKSVARLMMDIAHTF